MLIYPQDTKGKKHIVPSLCTVTTQVCLRLGWLIEEFSVPWEWRALIVHWSNKMDVCLSQKIHILTSSHKEFPAWSAVVFNAVFPTYMHLQERSFKHNFVVEYFIPEDSHPRCLLLPSDFYKSSLITMMNPFVKRSCNPWNQVFLCQDSSL